MTDSKFKITKINETMCKRGYEVVLKKLIVCQSSTSFLAKTAKHIIR
jgi:hypothetical protein